MSDSPFKDGFHEGQKREREKWERLIDIDWKHLPTRNVVAVAICNDAGDLKDRAMEELARRIDRLTAATNDRPMYSFRCRTHIDGNAADATVNRRLCDQSAPWAGCPHLHLVSHDPLTCEQCVSFRAGYDLGWKNRKAVTLGGNLGKADRDASIIVGAPRSKQRLWKDCPNCFQDWHGTRWDQCYQCASFWAGYDTRAEEE